jgi:hypothetical protein
MILFAHISDGDQLGYGEARSSKCSGVVQVSHQLNAGIEKPYPAPRILILLPLSLYNNRLSRSGTYSCTSRNIIVEILPVEILRTIY